MSTDRELLELAAKASGISCSWAHEDEADYSASTEGMWLNGERSPDNSKFWNPLTDDGDALRLAVKLQIEVCFDFTIPIDGDPMTATRRAIVLAAAEVGKAMP